MDTRTTRKAVDAPRLRTTLATLFEAQCLAAITVDESGRYGVNRAAMEGMNQFARMIGEAKQAARRDSKKAVAA